ncbi:calcium/sodium antiporter [Candidatus Pacearchaeota archaeon]|nr:calcium/sodium antiporter [Candidatus Pacearchaeota archaeon]
MVYINFLVLALWIVLLVGGSDYFVKSASRIAKRLGVSELVIGLILVANGTSIPELTVSIFSAIKGHTEIIAGNIVGSNIADLAWIAGLSALLYGGMKTNKLILRRDGYMMLFTTIIFFVFALTGSIKWYMGILFLILYAGYTYFLLKKKHRGEKHHLKEHLEIKDGLWKDILIFIISCIAIFIGGKYLVGEIIFIAAFFSIPETAIGILNAIGTTLPELTVSIIAGRKGMLDLLWGNIIGSNITNILFVVGASSLISPVEIIKLSSYFTIPFLLGLTILSLIFMRTKWKVSRFEGGILFALYLIFLAGLFYLRTGLI